MKVLALSGNMGVGKSTAIEILKRYNAKTPVHLVKFAAPLYDAQEFLYRRISSVVKRDSAFIKDRKLLQWLGTEWGRGLDADLWVKIWTEEVRRLYYENPTHIIVCDDCRFDNEAQAIKSLGGSIVRITSDKASSRINTQPGINNHSSESGIKIDFLDATVSNNSSIEEFKASLLTVYRSFNVLD